MSLPMSNPYQTTEVALSMSQIRKAAQGIHGADSPAPSHWIRDASEDKGEVLPYANTLGNARVTDSVLSIPKTSFRSSYPRVH